MKIAPLLISAVLLAPLSCLAQQRNLVLITIDTLRSDYLGCNGATQVQTPHLDALAKRGANFRRARSPVPLTLPAHASILTALDPPDHGVRDNAAFRLDPKIVTLAEILKGQGYITAAFTGAFVLDHRFGLDQGFDVYDDRMWKDVNTMESLDAERNADAVYDSFAKWFRSRSGTQPFFAWIHLYDPHAPYAPPEPFLSRHRKNPYAGEVAYVDSVAGRLLQLLEAQMPSTANIIAVIGDHGEGLGEHDEQAHSIFIYNSTLHVPMLIVAPGLIPPATQVTALCRAIDLAPTLVDYLGVRTKLGKGVSLRPLIERKPHPEVVAYSESFYPKLNLDWSELIGLETAQYKYIQAPKPELYDMQKDPGEKRNLVAELPEVAQRLRQQLPSAPRPAPANEPDEETRERLASLGYVSSGPAGNRSGAGGADPKDKIGLWNELQMVLHDLGRQRYETAIPALKKMLVREKNMRVLYEYLGKAYMELRDWTNAEKTYADARSLGMESSMIHLNLGVIAYEQKDFAKSEKQLQQALRLDPRNVTAYYRLGNVYRARKQYREALLQYQEALKIHPGYAYALDGMGTTYAALQQNQEALRYYERAIEADPSYGPAYFNYGMHLQRINRPADAVAAFQKFLKLTNASEYPVQRKTATEAIEKIKTNGD